MDTIDTAVIGAGVIGLAVARHLAQEGREVVVLEAADAIGTVTSSRNSEVIHAGIYYAKDSLRARLCVPGKRALYRYCAEHGVGHRRTGKLLVAVEEAEVAGLDAIRARAAANGVGDLKRLEAAEARALEPQLRCRAALFSPSSGIVDSHGLMLALQGDAETRGAMVAFNSPVTGGEARGDGIDLEVGGATSVRVLARTVVNCAGLGAQAIAQSIRGARADAIPPLHCGKGSYFTLAGRSPFRHLIYPVPGTSGWLGVHVTLDLAGRARFGPDLEWVAEPNYDVDPARADKYYPAIRRYWPGLPDGALQPGYAGVRPKLAPAGQPERDWVIAGPETTGVPGLINLFGIDSPGLTACLAIADAVGRKLDLPPDPLLGLS
ncbi:MAG: NAD(P)/FAD-dependent oxidoreductase [Rhodospirillales bacterium]|nr:NAD(P)/FAD-dependent oxidoreductase [Rhodospirillales bacterium]